MSQKEMEKTYQPKEIEPKIYEKWLEQGCFTPKINPKIKPYTIMIPPPNITGSLHMGHALNDTIQDIIVRYKRMCGIPTLWLPGTDHAGIATQNVVEKDLRKQGSSRHILGREKFIEKVWEWKEKYGDIILVQLKKLGCSCDWSRQRFTMDEGYSQAVKTAFIHYYNKGYIYQGDRVVNWCPRCQTAISDIEVKYEPQKAKLYIFKYDKNFPFSIATTRPETKLGDTAVAVNPSDERYKKYIGQTFEVNFVGQKLKIKVISDRNVDPGFGTGALGVTPAHSLVDFEMAEKNKLEILNVIGPDGKMTESAGKEFVGLTVLEAREKVIAKLRQAGLIEKEEDYENNLSLCDRCGTPIEPIISKQWFVKMDELAKKAAQVIEKEKVEFIPSRYKKVSLEWLKNIRDWCISRQLWWGHQLPVYYCLDCEKQSKIKNDLEKVDAKSKKIENCKLKIENSSDKCFIVALEKPKQCPFCGKCEMKQSEDVLDTWFSSALWPFATLGWPEKTKDLQYFYPTNFLATAPEILYLWVVRMIFSGLEFMDKIPFPVVYLHGTVLTKDGRRMSKSLGNGVDPLILIEKYGADATRFGIIYQTTRDLQAIHFFEEALLASQKFINKLWNIGRFIQFQEADGKAEKKQGLSLSDRWILSRLNKIIQSASEDIENYHLGKAAHDLYEFVWHELADWYLEIVKKEKNIFLVKDIYEKVLKLLHPFIPFVTEKLYGQFFSQNKDDLLVISDWPKSEKKFIEEKTEKDFLKIQRAVLEIRNQKKENSSQKNIEFEAKLKISKKENDFYQEHKNLIEFLSRAKIVLE